MSAAAFDRALALTLGIEGGLSNRKADRGGLTFRGVTQRLYDAWRDNKGLPRQEVTLASDAEIRAIALEEFWQPCKCDALPDALAIAVFDEAFNSSPANAIRTLQASLGVAVDGVLGPHTLEAAAASTDPVLAFLKARAGFITAIVRQDATQLENLHGWIDRLLDQAWAAARP